MTTVLVPKMVDPQFETFFFFPVAWRSLSILALGWLVLKIHVKEITFANKTNIINFKNWKGFYGIRSVFFLPMCKPYDYFPSSLSNKTNVINSSIMTTYPGPCSKYIRGIK